MKLLDLWAALCGDGGQPWPADSLYDVEGLNYFEAMKVLKMHQDGEALPSATELTAIIAEREAQGFDLARDKDKLAASKAIPLLVKAARRKAMAAALGVTDPRQQGDLAREAGTALDRVTVAAKKAGVQLDLSRRGSRRELLDVAARLYASNLKRERGDVVEDARKLIEAVDEATR